MSETSLGVSGDSCTVVLVRTFNPGNLGSAARAAKAFGARLVLVAPMALRTHPDALAYASGAEDLLDAAEVVDNLADLRDRGALMVALSSLRSRREAGLPPAMTWGEVRAEKKTLLVFGPERGGLRAEELRLSDRMIALATRPEYPTLNLAQAVAASLALLSEASAPLVSPLEQASAHEVALAIDAFKGLLARAGYPPPGRAADAIPTLTRLITRAAPTPEELQAFRAAIAALGR